MAILTHHRVPSTGRLGRDDGQGQAAGHLGAQTPSSSSAALHHPTASCDQSIDHGQKPYPGHQALDPPHLIFSLPTTEGILSGFRYHPLSSTPSLAACTRSLDTESRFEGTSSGPP